MIYIRFWNKSRHKHCKVLIAFGIGEKGRRTSGDQNNFWVDNQDIKPRDEYERNKSRGAKIYISLSQKKNRQVWRKQMLVSEIEKDRT